MAAPLRAHRCFEQLRSPQERLGHRSLPTSTASRGFPAGAPTDYRESYSARHDEGGVLLDLVHEIDYVVALYGAPLHLSASLLHSGPLEMAADRTADPLGRMASEDDFRGVVTWLAGDASTTVTGQVIAVNGGWTAWS